jgi:hypothetical protein
LTTGTDPGDCAASQYGEALPELVPSQDILIVVQQTDGRRELRMAKWGFVLFFTDGKPGKSPPTVNA